MYQSSLDQQRFNRQIMPGSNPISHDMNWRHAQQEALPEHPVGFHPFYFNYRNEILTACNIIATATNCAIELCPRNSFHSCHLLKISSLLESNIRAARKAIDLVTLEIEDAKMASYLQDPSMAVEPVARFYYRISKEDLKGAMRNSEERIRDVVRSANCTDVKIVEAEGNAESPIFLAGNVEAVRKARDLLNEAVDRFQMSEYRKKFAGRGKTRLSDFTQEEPEMPAAPPLIFRPDDPPMLPNHTESIYPEHFFHDQIQFDNFPTLPNPPTSDDLSVKEQDDFIEIVELDCKTVTRKQLRRKAQSNRNKAYIRQVKRELVSPERDHYTSERLIVVDERAVSAKELRLMSHRKNNMEFLRKIKREVDSHYTRLARRKAHPYSRPDETSERPIRVTIRNVTVERGDSPTMEQEERRTMEQAERLTMERPNSRTMEQAERRTMDRVHSPTMEQAESRTMERAKRRTMERTGRRTRSRSRNQRRAVSPQLDRREQREQPHNGESGQRKANREETDEEFRERLRQNDRAHFYGRPGPAELLGRQPAAHNDTYPLEIRHAENIDLRLFAAQSGCELELMDPTPGASHRYQNIGMNGTPESIGKARELLDNFIMDEEKIRAAMSRQDTIQSFLRVPADIRGMVDKHNSKWERLLGPASGVVVDRVRNRCDECPPRFLRGSIDNMTELYESIAEFYECLRNPVTEEFYVLDRYAGVIIGRRGQAIKDLQSQTGARVDVRKEVTNGGRRAVIVSGLRSRVTKAMKKLDKMQIGFVRFDVEVPRVDRTAGDRALRNLRNKLLVNCSLEERDDGSQWIVGEGILENAHKSKHLIEVELGLIAKNTPFRSMSDHIIRSAANPSLTDDERNRLLCERLNSEMAEKAVME